MTGAIIRNAIDGLGYLVPAGSAARSGTYRFHIDVMDNAGNLQRYPAPNQSYQIVLDYEAPAISAGTLAVTEESGSGSREGMVDVNVGSLVVTDAGYTNASGQPDYWGYWIVVKRADSGTPTSDEWLTRGTVVQQAGSPFKWNLATGLADAFEPGAQYRLYLRFLDGAANPSSAVVSAPIQVDALGGPRLFLPVEAGKSHKQLLCFQMPLLSRPHPAWVKNTCQISPPHPSRHGHPLACPSWR
jgi:hypothetical protein